METSFEWIAWINVFVFLILRGISFWSRFIYLARALFWVALLPASLLLFAFFTRQKIDLFGPTPLMSDGGRYFPAMGVDVLSAVMIFVVTVIGLVTLRYSVRYLEDDPKREAFFSNMTFTLTSVLILLVSRNLVLFFLGWASTSLFLHRLLVHFEDRPAAVAAAGQKFFVSRMGDVFLLTAFVMIYSIFGSVDFDEIFHRVSDQAFLENHRSSLGFASLALVAGAMTKSAQFPFHFWLPNTMETPTPVSALMHAGIINAGGYLVIRMSPLLVEFSGSLDLLATVGGITAVMGSLCMLTQTDVKRSLAYSTISQMGFMMLQCGLGAFTVAVLHIFGHSFYKAYAFLSAGSTIDLAWINRFYGFFRFQQSSTAPSRLALSLLTAFSILVALAMLLGVDLQHKPGAAILTLILGLAMAQTILSSSSNRLAIFYSMMICGAYFALYKILSHAFYHVLPKHDASYEFVDLIMVSLVGGLFLFLYWIQNNLSLLTQRKWGLRLYVAALNGFYMGRNY